MKTPTAMLLAAALVAGCQGNLTAVVKPAARPAASSKPGVPPAAAKTLAPPAKLVRPSGGATVLAGHVSLDPAYVVGLEAGQVISEAGSSVLAAGKVVSNDGASVVSNDGHSVVSNDGHSIVSNDGNSVVSNDGHSIVSNDGNSVISNDGASIISNDGGSVVAQGAGNVIAPASILAKDAGGIISNDGNSVISNDGASIISNDGASAVKRDRALLATAANRHELVPAAGMAVYVRDLVTHAKIPLGQGSDGKPVYAVYTDLAGGYELYLPPGLQNNVEVVAFLPDKPDTRLHLQHVTPAATADSPVDEDTSAVVNYIRFGFRQFTTILITGDEEALVKAGHLDEIANLSTGYRLALADLAGRIRAAGIPQIKDPARRDQIADRITDIVLAHARLDLAVPSDNHGSDNPFGPEISAHSLSVLAENFRRRRQDVADIIDQPGVREKLNRLPIVVEAGQRDHTTYQFQRPSDYADFVARAIVGVPGTDPTAVTEAIDRLDGQADLPARKGTSAWVQAAFGGVVHQLALALFVSGDVQDGLDKLFAEVHP